MHISFMAIRLKNFLTVGNSFETINLCGAPFTAIIGKNGVGKSTIIDALVYVLYGKPYRKINLPQLVNSINKKQSVVEVIFKVGNHTYMVRRGQGPKIFEIYKNSQLVPEESVSSDYQKYLENEVLGQNMKTFCQVNVISKANYKPFMELAPADRRSIVEDLLDSHIYGVMLQIAKDRLKNINSTVTEVTTERKILEAKVESIETLMESFNRNRDIEIESLENKISDIVAYIQEANEELQSALDEVEQLNNEYLKIVKDPQKLTETYNILKSQAFSLKRDIQRHEETITKIDSLDNCPVCLQVVDETHKNHIITETEAQQSQLKDQLKISEDRIFKCEGIITEGDTIKKKIADINNDMTTIQNNISRAKTQQDIYTKRLEELRAPLEPLPDSENLEDIKSAVVALTDRLDALAKDVDYHKQAVKLLGDDGIKAEIINKYIPIINTKLNEYLERMDLLVGFEVDNQFNETIKSMYRDKYSYHSFSEGQKARIEGAILLTWREIARIRNSTSTNILILDEIMDGSLEEQGVTDFFNILKENSDQHIFVISHKDSTIDLFENVIHVKMEGNFATYEQS